LEDLTTPMPFSEINNPKGEAAMSTGYYFTDNQVPANSVYDK
jgi:hypothetical protein